MTAQLPSRERLQEIIDVDARCNPEVRALARALLAAHEQEPVGEVIEMRGGLIMDGVINLDSRTYREISGINKMKRMPLGTKFYANPAPVPTVPDEMTIRDACKFVQDMRIFDDVAVIVMRTWNACRAAMLNGGKS